MTERNISTKTLVLAICSALLVALLLMGMSGANASNTGTMQTPASAKALVAGGIDPDAIEHQGKEAPQSTEKTISTTIVWTAKAPMPTPRGQMAIVTGDDGLIYAMGGYDNAWKVLNTNEVYDPKADTWSTKASMPVPTRGAAHAKGFDGKIYIFGGFDSSWINTTQIYNPSTNSWTLGAPIPSGSGVWYAAAATGDDGKIYVIGGESDAGTNWTLDLVQIYNPATDTWSLGTPMPTPRLGLGVVKIKGLIYAIGGFNRVTQSVVNTVEAYDPATNTWSKKSPLNIARFEFGSALATGNINAIGGANGIYLPTNEEGSPSDGKIWVMGGSSVYVNNAPPYFSSVEIYDVATDTWAAGTDLPVGRRELEADSTAFAAPSVSISSDKARYSPGDTMTITLNITNPTRNPVILEWYIGVPHSNKWITEAIATIPAGYSKTHTIPIPIGNWGPSPLGLVHYVHILDPTTREVLAQDAAVFAYSPIVTNAPQVDIAEELMKQRVKLSN